MVPPSVNSKEPFLLQRLPNGPLCVQHLPSRKTCNVNEPGFLAERAVCSKAYSAAHYSVGKLRIKGGAHGKDLVVLITSEVDAWSEAENRSVEIKARKRPGMPPSKDGLQIAFNGSCRVTQFVLASRGGQDELRSQSDYSVADIHHAHRSSWLYSGQRVRALLPRVIAEATAFAEGLVASGKGDVVLMTFDQQKLPCFAAAERGWAVIPAGENTSGRGGGSRGGSGGGDRRGGSGSRGGGNGGISGGNRGRGGRGDGGGH